MKIIKNIKAQIFLFVGVVSTLGIFAYKTFKNKQKKNKIDDTQNSQEFKEAAQHSRTFKNLNQQQQLVLYGLYKQATIGDCNIPKPTLIDIAGQLKWDAWNSQQGMSKEEAEGKYILYVISVGQALKTNKQQAQQQNSNSNFGFKVSTLSASQGDNQEYIEKFNIKHEDKIQILLSEEDKNIVEELIQMIQNGDNNKINETLNKISQIDLAIQYLNEQGICLIHQSIDCQNSEAFQILLPYYTQRNLINIRDSIYYYKKYFNTDVSGMTPIHYAALIDDEKMVMTLLQSGANPYIKDFSGEEAYKNCSKEIQMKIDLLMIKK